VAGEGFFYQAFVYLSAAVVSVPVAKRLDLGSVLGYLIAGAAIGPFGFGFVGEEGSDVMHFAEFGVVMMLFLVGLELEPTLLLRLRRQILGLGGLQVLLTTVAFTGAGLALGLDWRVSLAVGMTLSLSSTALVLQSLAEKGLLKTTAGQSSFAVLLFQDLAVIPMLALFPLLAPHAASAGGEHGGGHGTTWVSGLPAWGQTLAVLAAVAAVILAGRFLVQPVLRAVARTRLRELFTAAALLLIIGIAILMTKVGLSPALGTFLAGVVLANSEYRHELESDIEPFKGLLLGLFFIAVGASIDFHLLATRPGTIAGLVAAAIAIKFVLLLGLARLFRMSTDQGLLFSFSLPQLGEFGFVLLSFGASVGLFDSAVTDPLVAVVALSMAASPLLMVLFEKVIRPRVGTVEKDAREADRIDEENTVIIAGFGRFGSIVGRLLRANGVGATVLDNDSDRVDILRRLGLKVFYGDATPHDLLEAAGAGNARFIVLALDNHEKNLELVHTVKKHFPDLTILARAIDRPDAYALMDAGVEHVYRETFDSSLRLGVKALRLLGRRGYQAERAARTFRRHDDAALDELRAVRQDREAYLGVARRRIADLERVLLADLTEEKETDAGWDSEPIRQDVGLATRGSVNESGGRVDSTE
jgi:monovalent cation:proton antiporter-2 (CPA2) family protein